MSAMESCNNEAKAYQDSTDIVEDAGVRLALPTITLGMGGMTATSLVHALAAGEALRCKRALDEYQQITEREM